MGGGGGSYRGVGSVWVVLIAISPMVTSMKSTHGSVPFKNSVVRLYIAALCFFALYSIGGVNMGNKLFGCVVSMC